jgi:hypothetical protein
MSNPVDKVVVTVSSDCQFGPGGFHTYFITSKDQNDRRLFKIHFDDPDGTEESMSYTIDHTDESFKCLDAALTYLIAKEKI